VDREIRGRCKAGHVDIAEAVDRDAGTLVISASAQEGRKHERSSPGLCRIDLDYERIVITADDGLRWRNRREIADRRCASCDPRASRAVQRNRFAQIAIRPADIG
jgi:hypothetical protein